MIALLDALINRGGVIKRALINKGHVLNAFINRGKKMSIHIHLLGICGTFMGSLAILAKEMGFVVTGSDKNVYPPMSTLLESKGIKIFSGHDEKHLDPLPDCVVIGNVMSRGMPIIEYILDNNIPFFSGPFFLKNHILKDKHVIAVSGTHGKTTTSSMLAWVLDYLGYEPGFLIGGVLKNFNVSARLGSGKYFVIEADEYDSAFFDKRSKFVHYKPNTLIINNIEFDHADIFDDLKDIKRQFHHLVRIIPSNGKVIYNKDDLNVDSVLKMGAWSRLESFGVDDKSDWKVKDFDQMKLKLLGKHNKLNAIAVIAALNDIGILPEKSIEALEKFDGVKRRLELVGEFEDNNIKIFDDFAHHPTAIKSTIEALKKSLGCCKRRILAIVDICSNTMRMGHHRDKLVDAAGDANLVYFFHGRPLNWDFEKTIKENFVRGVFSDPNKVLEKILEDLNDNDVILILSNGACSSIMQELLAKSIEKKFSFA